MKSRYLLTYTNRRISPERGAPSLLDIAVQLGRIARFAGACSRFYSVLIHSLLVADLVPQSLEIYGLLHDASEVVFGDIPGPVKPERVREEETAILYRLFRSLGVRQPSEAEWKEVKAADRRAYVAENEVLRGRGRADSEARFHLEKYLRQFPNYRDTLAESGAAVREFLRRARLRIVKCPVL